MRNVKFRYNSRVFKVFPKWVAAFAFKNTIYVRGDSISPRLRKHEEEHIKQQRELGIIMFLLQYIGEYIFNIIKYRDSKKAYKNISFEIRAREEEKRLD